MPGVLQVEALAQTMAVYVAKQPGFGDRIGLFAGIDEVRFKRIVVPGDTLRLEVTMEKLGSRFGKGRGVASVDGEVACEGLLSFIIPPAGVLAMTRIAVLSDVHGNLPALEAVLAEIRAERPDAVLVAGDLVLNGPDPAAVVDALRALEADGAAIVSGNTDIAVADFDYGAAFPHYQDGVPRRRSGRRGVGPRRAGRRAARRGSAGCPPSAACAPPTTRWSSSSTPPRARQTRGFDQALDANVIFERAAATDARVICVGHTHIPEVRDLGWKVIVNDGSAGYVFDGDPTASWASLTIVDGEVHAEIRRTDVRRADGRQRHLRPRPAGRRLPRGDGPHREAGPMTWALAGRSRAASSSPAWAPSRRSATTSPSTWAGLLAGRSGVAHDHRLRPVAARPSGSRPRSRTSTRPTSSTARRCGGPTATSSSRSCARTRRCVDAGPAAAPRRRHGGADRA